MSDTIWGALIGALAGAIGAIIGNIFSLIHQSNSNKTEIKKINAEVITRERLRWLQSLRADYTDFVVETRLRFFDVDSYYRKLQKNTNTPEMTDNLNTEMEGIIKNGLEKITKLRRKIRLNLNLKKVSHNSLNGKLSEILRLVNSIHDLPFEQLNLNEATETFFRLVNEADEFMEVIGKEVWEKVKNLE